MFSKQDKKVREMGGGGGGRGGVNADSVITLLRCSEDGGGDLLTVERTCFQNKIRK